MRRLVVAAACMLLLAGVQAIVGTTASAQSDAPKVRVLKPGTGSREPLRLTFVAGQTSAVQLTTELKLEQELDGESRDTKIPAIVIGLSTTVSELTPEGGAVVDFRYDDARVEDDGSLSGSQLEDVRDAIEELVGVTGSVSISPTGAVSGGNFEVPPDVSGQTRALLQQFEDQLSQLAVPFPEEPVGKAARWQVSQSVELSGVRINQTATYTLQSRSGDGVQLAVKIKQRAPRQDINSATLLSHKGTGSGRTDLRFDQPLPTSSHLRLASRQRLEASGQTLNQTTTAEVRLEPGD